MANLGREVYSFRDVTGQVETMSLNVNSVANATALVPLLQAVSSAHVCAARGPYTVADDGVSGANTTYADVEDKAVLVFKSPGGASHKLSIPAPLQVSFLASDRETWDAALAANVALTNAITALGTDGGGANYTSFSKGFRRRRISKRG
jgi:hypothetical protein